MKHQPHTPDLQFHEPKRSTASLVAVGAASLSLAAGLGAEQGVAHAAENPLHADSHTLVTHGPAQPKNFQEFLNRQSPNHLKSHGHHSANHRSGKLNKHINERLKRKWPYTMPSFVIPGEHQPEPQNLINLHPESLKVSPEAARIAAENTVYLDGSHCSGFLVRDKSGTPVGVSTAVHCGMLDKDGKRQTDESGQTILSYASAITAYTGDVFGQLNTVSEVTDFLLPAADDLSIDETLGAFAGHSMQEVMDNFNQMPAQDINHLHKGDIIYNSGWPVDQPNDGGTMKRQVFPMVVLGIARSMKVSSGQTIDAVIAAVPKNAQNTECSWGNSGSMAFQVKNSTLLRIGTASVFNDFGMLYNKDKPIEAQNYKYFIENKFGVSMDGFAGICGFSFKTASPDKGGVIAKVKYPNVQPEPQPLPPPPEQPTYDINQDIADAKEAFNNPAQPKQVVDGLLYVDQGKTGQWIKNPVLYQTKDGGIVALHSETKDGEPIAAFFNNSDQIKLYSDEADDSMSAFNTIGKIDIDSSGNWLAQSQNQDGTKTQHDIGELIADPLKPGQQYTMYFGKGGEIVLQKYVEPTKGGPVG